MGMISLVEFPKAIFEVSKPTPVNMEETNLNKEDNHNVRTFDDLMFS